MKLIVDTREPDKYYNFLKTAFPNIDVIQGTLKEGDYESDRCLFERKTLVDLYGSVIGGNGKGGRLWKQMDRMATHDDMIVGVLVTGNIKDTVHATSEIGVPFDPEIVYSAIGHIQCSYQFPVFWIDNEWSALVSMVKYMKYCGDDKVGVPMRRDPDVLAARLLKVSTFQWHDLKVKFGSLENMGNASKKDLQSIYGIGPVKAKFIQTCIKDRL